MFSSSLFLFFPISFFPLLVILFHVFNSSGFGHWLIWNWGPGVGLGKEKKESGGNCGFTFTGDL